jgi:hypothetical protein
MNKETGMKKVKNGMRWCGRMQGLLGVRAQPQPLVKHPRGDLLINTGSGRRIVEQFATKPPRFLAITFYRLWRAAADPLRETGYDQKSLRANSSGPCASRPPQRSLPDFPDVPLWVTQFGKPLIGIGEEEFGFEGGPYLRS